MNSAQLKCLAVFSVFAVIGFGPISPGCFIGMFLVVMRPEWFWNLVGDLYAPLPLPAPVVIPGTALQVRRARLKAFFSLLGLLIIDILPVPVTPAIAFYVILARPVWFYQVVARVYGKTVAA